MANLYITEFSRLCAASDGETVPVGPLDEVIASQVVSFTTSTQSAAFNSKTRYVRVYSDSAAHVRSGGNPTATTSDTPISADQAEYFGVRGGQKIAAVTQA